jgi:hypothetical protein
MQARTPGTVALALLLFLSFLVLDMPGASADTNNSFDEAEEIQYEAGKIKQVLAYIDSGSDPVDFYRITADEAMVIDVRVGILQYNDDDPTEKNYDLEVFDAGKDQPVTYDRTQDRFEATTWLCLYTGLYYFKITAVSGSGDYTITLTVYDPPEMEDGHRYDGYVKQNSDHDTDWYKIYLKGDKENQAVYVNMTHDDTGNLDLRLADLWNGKSYYLNISWWMGPPNEEVYGVASYTGYYYLKVNAYSGWSDYRIRVEVTEPGSDCDNTPATSRFLKYNTTWTDHVDQGEDKYDFFSVDLDQNEELSLDMRLLNSWEHIYSLFVFDENMVTEIEKTNYIFEPEHDTGPTITYTYKAGQTGRYYIAAMAKIALTSDPDNLSDITASADYVITLNMSLHDLKPPNRAPYVKKNMTVNMQEDTVEHVLLNDVFSDPDGDQLTFTVKATELKVTVESSGRMTIMPKPDWAGNDEVNITARDPEGLEAHYDMPVTVTEMPEPPEIINYGPTVLNRMNENETVTLFVEVRDDDTPSGSIAIKWYVDNILGGQAPVFNYTPGFEDAGNRIVRVEIKDGDYTVKKEWDITVLNVNRQPVILQVTPETGSKYKKGETVSLAATLQDPDGDTISYAWKEGGRILISGQGNNAFLNTTLSPGTHILVIDINDGQGGATYREVKITITTEESEGPWLFVVASVLVLSLIAVTAVYLTYRHLRQVDEEEIDELIEEEIDFQDRKKRKRPGSRRKRGGRKHRKKAKKKVEEE